MDTSAWSAQLLAEFIAAVSTAETEAGAARAAIEHAAEALDADVAAIVCGGELVAAVGYPEGRAPVAELEGVRPGAVDAWLEVPGVGPCAAAAAMLEYPPGATLVLARSEPDGMSREETGLLRGMARVAAMTMRMLRVLDDERSAREELRTVAEEQAALRRVAVLVARAAPPEDVFAAVAAEVGQVLDADYTFLSRYDPDGGATLLATWARTVAAPPVPVGYRLELGGRNLHTLVFQTSRPTRIDDYANASGPVAATVRAVEIRSAVGTPISVGGRLWGVMSVGSTRAEPLPADSEARLAAFTELVATAIANAESQAALTASRARIVATADATRRRIERDRHDGAQQRLVSLSLQLRAAQAAAPPEAGELAQRLDDVVAGLTSVLGELSEIARGIHPAILADGGLRPALKALARRCAVPVHLDVQVEGRLSEPIEIAAYYVISEALTNAAKHGHASAVDVEVAAGEGVLHVRVRDDGRGGAAFGHGSGLVGLKDRVEALGGRISLHSPPGGGTTVEIALPLGDPGPRCRPDRPDRPERH